MALTDNLVSYWKLDEASGNALDAHGSNTLTDTNSVGTGTGKINGCRDFEAGSTQYFSLADNDDLSIADNTVSYTWTAWANLESTGTRQIVTKRTGVQVGNAMEYTIRVDTNVPKIYWGAGGTFGSLSSGVTMSLATWYFVVAGYDASTNKFFISVNDGTVTESAAVTTQTVNGTNGFGIGASQGSELWDGLIDEVGFWKGRRLSTTEITQLYNSGNGLSYDSFGGGGAVTEAKLLVPTNMRGGMGRLAGGFQ